MNSILNRKRSSNALIIFTREPVPGKTKTRLMPYYTPEQCALLHENFLRDICRQTRHIDADLLVSYTGGSPSMLRKIFGKRAVYFEQKGDGLGSRMENAVAHALSLGYERAVLIGTDIPELRAETLNDAFRKLGRCDMVIGPTYDGGYYLAGMSRVIHEAFDIKHYGTGSVLEETLSSLRSKGITAGLCDAYSDIDEPADIAALRHRIRAGAMRRTHTAVFLRESASISVIIPVYNESSTVRRLMDQLRTAADETEIIFVDGGSTDGTADLIGHDFRVIRSGKGRGIQMNAGAKASSGDILLFLHCDSSVPEDMTAQIRNVMAHKEWGCFGVRFPSRNFFMLTNRIISNYRALFRGLPFGDQGIFIDRELFFEAGMFPEIPLMEDYEFSRRMKNMRIRPGMTRSRICSSARRYGNGTIGILRTELLMWKLRLLYRMGADICGLEGRYPDCR